MPNGWIPESLRTELLEQGFTEADIADIAEEYAKLLVTPCLPTDELRAVGIEPGEYSHLIHLTDREGFECYPTFQFDENWRPYTIVLEVNEYHGVRRVIDRLSTWQWWVSRNAWLPDDQCPADLIGKRPDAEILRLAQTVAEDI
jgi:hypothetical protein